MQRILHDGLNLARGQLLEGCGAEIFDFDGSLPFFYFGVDGDVFLQVAFEPAAMIERFADADAIEPGFQRAALPETANATKSLEEDFLRAIGGVRRITEHAEDEVID